MIIRTKFLKHFQKFEDVIAAQEPQECACYVSIC